MRPIEEFHRPTTVDEALELHAAQDDATFIAGGQSLTQMLKQRIVEPDALIDISRLSDLDYITDGDDVVRIGALTKHNTLKNSSLLAGELPTVVEMVKNVGDEQIRNMGTIGGDIAQSDPSSDYPPVAVVLDADLAVRSPDGSRTIPAEEFFVGYYENDLDDEELLTEIRFPKHPAGRVASYEKFSLREGDFAMASVGARLDIEAGTCTDARLVASAVSFRPERLRDVEDVLSGATLDGETIEAAAEAARTDADPMGDPVNGSREYKQQLVSSLTTSVLEQAIDRSTEVSLNE